MRLRIMREQLTRLARVTGLTEQQIESGYLNKQELQIFENACRFVKVKHYEETRYRKRN